MARSTLGPRMALHHAAGWQLRLQRRARLPALCERPRHLVPTMPILESLREAQPAIAALRRDIHAHPELAFEEFATGDAITTISPQANQAVVNGVGGLY